MGELNRIVQEWDHEFMDLATGEMKDRLVREVPYFRDGCHVGVSGNSEAFQLYLCNVQSFGPEVTEAITNIFPGDYFQVTDLQVAEGSRRMGVGRAIYDFVESVALDNGCKRGLAVMPSSEVLSDGGRAFFNGMGFAAIKDNPRREPDFKVLVKDLPARIAAIPSETELKVADVRHTA